MCSSIKISESSSLEEVPTPPATTRYQTETWQLQVEWQGTGPAVQVSFQQNGKTVVTVPGMLKTNDDQVIQDAIVTDKGMLRTKCGSWHRLRIEVHFETCDS